MPLTSENAALAPQFYDQEEEKGRATLSNRIIEAFQPQVFNATGYPVHVSAQAELWRYVDVMHETRLKSTIEDLLQGLTADEFALFQRAVRFMIEFTTATFGRPLRCENALMRAIGIFRYIRAAKPKRVIEFGPGSGYLGLLHILDGISYIGVENTQAFYLLQNRMWAAAAKSGFCELAGNPMTFREVTARLTDYQAVHVPWWKVVDVEPAELPLAVDLVTANHCLAEMHDSAMKYYVRMAFAALRKSRGPFVFEGWGYELLRSRGIVAREFDATGFRMCHVEDRAVAFSSDPAMGDFQVLPRTTSVREKFRSMSRRLLRLDTILHGYEIASYSGANPLSAFVRATQENAKRVSTIGYDDVMAFLTSVYGEKHASQEERFLERIGKSYL